MQLWKLDAQSQARVALQSPWLGVLYPPLVPSVWTQEPHSQELCWSPQQMSKDQSLLLPHRALEKVFMCRATFRESHRLVIRMKIGHKKPKKSPSQCRRSPIWHRTKPPTWLPMAITKLLLPPAPTAAGNQGKKFWSSVCYLPSCSQIAPSVGDPPQDQRQNYSQK